MPSNIRGSCSLNGVTLLNDGKRIALGSNSMPAVLMYDVDVMSHELILDKTLRALFMVDNVRPMLQTRRCSPGIEQVSARNLKFDLDGTGEGKQESERSTAGSWAVEWDGNEVGRYVEDFAYGNGLWNKLYGGEGCREMVCLMVGLYEEGIMVWKEK